MMAARHQAPGADVDLAEQINRRLRKQVFRRYALLRDGKPVFCRAAGGKIVYPTMEAAIAAGAELTRIDTGHPMNAYECHRGEHYHLAHRRAPGTADAVRLMDTQETLPGTGQQHTFNPMDHGLWKRLVDPRCDCKTHPHQSSHGHVNHGQWLRARAEGQWVGTCRRCGDYLTPEQPYEHSGRTDYQASCRTQACGYVMSLPGGRIALGSTRKSERK